MGEESMPEGRNTPATNLPESLFVMVRNSGGTGGQGAPEHFDVVKAENPEGELVAFAFTRPERLSEFAKRIGLDESDATLNAIEISTSTYLAQLAAAHETKVHINPSCEDECVLSYDGHGVLSPQNDPGERSIRKPDEPLPELFRKSLQDVAASLPSVEAIWYLESAPVEIDKDEQDPANVQTRMLLAVKQNVPDDHEQYDHAFMELGDRWCESLPPGIAVDMVPADIQVVSEYLLDESKVFSR